MTRLQRRQVKDRARIWGSIVLILLIGWLALTAAQVPAAPADLPGWLIALMGAAATGLVVWGSTKTKVERLEMEMDKRVTHELFTQAIENLCSRLERIEGHLDGKKEEKP